MLLFIPMAGAGDRFRRAGFERPKPLIEVDGRPIVAHILDQFPKGQRILFGVNRGHARETDILEVLRALAPQAEVALVDPHKDGPIQTALACADKLPPDEDVLLHYCDFAADWSYPAFRTWLDSNQWDGAMTAYRGFHPHSLGPTLYAYLRSEGDRVVEIREKHHFTADKFAEFASSGLYWFRSGRLLLELAQKLLSVGERVNGEYYVSMAMQALIEQGGRVGVHALRHFYQWGTPEDLIDYQGWSNAMRGLDEFLRHTASVQSLAAQVLPMAGRGQRFVDKGINTPKPLIDVAGKPMVAQAMACLPRPTRRVLIAQRAHTADPRLAAIVGGLNEPTSLLALDGVTEGQACTAALGIEALASDQPVLIPPCDGGYSYDVDAWLSLERSAPDLVVWTARHHLPARWKPEHYGWLVADDAGRVRRAAVKEPASGAALSEQETMVGTFYCRKKSLLEEQIRRLRAADERVNGEFYLDSVCRRMVAEGADVRAFRVDKFMPWGVPGELAAFEYWNEVFRGGRVAG